jgi:hypothetical protein
MLCLSRYICHVVEQAYQLVESKVESKVESYYNIQACQNESVANELKDVRADLAEVTVSQHEEKDGRVNEGWVYFTFYVRYDRLALFCIHH